jgi:CBS domain containing-hemolysin-like protein
MTLDDFNEAVGTRLPQDAAHTMAGFVFNALGQPAAARRRGRD